MPLFGLVPSDMVGMLPGVREVEEGDWIGSQSSLTHSVLHTLGAVTDP